ncbi:9821_t:CDS:1, partial [Acaulospora morrowiae]
MKMIQDKGKTVASGSSFASVALSKIALRISTFKEEFGENIEVWLHQIKNILYIQDIKNE